MTQQGDSPSMYDELKAKGAGYCPCCGGLVTPDGSQAQPRPSRSHGVAPEGDPMTDLRGLQAAMALGSLTPAELWEEIQRLSPLAAPDAYLVECRNCGEGFWTHIKPRGTKWTSLCTSCLRDEV
jgi:hypothetical protein